MLRFLYSNESRQAPRRRSSSRPNASTSRTASVAYPCDQTSRRKKNPISPREYSVSVTQMRTRIASSSEITKSRSRSRSPTNAVMTGILDHSHR